MNSRTRVPSSLVYLSCLLAQAGRCESAAKRPFVRRGWVLFSSGPCRRRLKSALEASGELSFRRPCERCSRRARRSPGRRSGPSLAQNATGVSTVFPGSVAPSGRPALGRPKESVEAKLTLVRSQLWWGPHCVPHGRSAHCRRSRRPRTSFADGPRLKPSLH